MWQRVSCNRSCPTVVLSFLFFLFDRLNSASAICFCFIGHRELRCICYFSFLSIKWKLMIGPHLRTASEYTQTIETTSANNCWYWWGYSRCFGKFVIVWSSQTSLGSCNNRYQGINDRMLHTYIVMCIRQKRQIGVPKE